jgi:glutamate-1-semialdehyde aminotransferase
MSRIFGDASTFSKMPNQWPSGFAKAAAFGRDHVLTDETGVEIFDTIGALGSRLYGYKYDDGGMLSMASIEEGILADLIAEKIPMAEMVRYGCNGADAVEGAIRYARNYTQRQAVYSVGYHSCQSPFTMNTSPAYGCIQGGVKQFANFKELIEALQWIRPKSTDVAAVIIEPVMTDLQVLKELHDIRQLTADKGIVLIFDEIITGMRVPKYCIANWYDIKPDLLLLGKALGGGYPLSVIAGSRDIMNRAIFHSYTFAGFPLALRAAIEILRVTSETELMDFWVRSGKFRTAFNLMDYGVKLDGYNTRGIWAGPDRLVWTFWQQMNRYGYLMGRAFFPRIDWAEGDFDQLLKTSSYVLCDIVSNGIELQGEEPRPLFRR